jgi:hypothetical protein
MRDDPFPPSNGEHAAPLNEFFRASFGSLSTQVNDGYERIREAAAMDFEPWTHRPGRWEPPVGRDLRHDHPQNFLTLRLASRMLQQSKGGLVDLARHASSLDDKDIGLVALVDSLAEAEVYFGALLEIITTAQARLLAAASVVALEQLKGQADD